MKVILLDEIKGKGGEGDVVEVAQGYAENFLFPKKLAVAATKGNLKQLDERRNNIAKREAVRLATANETKAAFEGKTVTVDVKVGDEGILFGSVTAAMIADAIKAQLGMDIDRKRVELGKPIKLPVPTPLPSRCTARSRPRLSFSSALPPRSSLPRLRSRRPLRSPRPRPPRSRLRLLPSSICCNATILF